MKKYLSKFNITYEFVKEATYTCLNSNNRWKRRDTKIFLAKYYQKYLEVRENKICSRVYAVNLMNENIPQNKEKFYPVVDWIAGNIFIEIITRTIFFPPINYDERYDNTSGKFRKIGTLSLKQQIYDYIVVLACKEMFFAKFGYYQVGAVPKKGQKFARQTIEYWTRSKPKKCRYICKADVYHFYNTVDHNVLKRLLERDIKNDDIIYVSFVLIDTFNEGLCIGSFVCQYWANYILSYLYHYLTEKLYSERRGKRINWVNFVLFQMDDIYLFASNKKYLKMAVKAMEKYLNEELKLELKPTLQIFPLGSRPIDVVGYKIYIDKTTIRKKNYKRIKGVCKKINKQGGKMNLFQARRIISYNGFIKYSNSHRFQKEYNIEEIMNNAKEVISNDSKKCRI